MAGAHNGQRDFLTGLQQAPLMRRALFADLRPTQELSVTSEVVSEAHLASDLSYVGASDLSFLFDRELLLDPVAAPKQRTSTIYLRPVGIPPSSPPGSIRLPNGTVIKFTRCLNTLRA
jgi:hypothetical protein